MKRSILFLTLTLALPLMGADWPQWRGPAFNGSTPETGLPRNWSRTENVRWKAAMPGPSASTPIVWKEKVFVSTTDTGEDSLKALCLDRNTGKVIWSRTVSRGTIRQDDRSNYASPSPATDGKVVVFFYGDGELAGFDLEGRKLWQRNIQEDEGTFAFLWTFSSSPLLLDGLLYLQVLQRDVPVGRRGRSRDATGDIESYLLAMKPTTGETVWRHVRPSEARAESREAFTTPIPFEHRGRKSILVIGGDALTAHDPVSGNELWRWGTWNPTRIGHWRHVPSPVASGDIILVCAPKRDPVYAIRAGDSGVLGQDAVSWVSRDSRDISSDVPTPAFHDGDFFVLSDVRKSISRVVPDTGKALWTTELPGFYKYEASPLLADGRVFLMNFAGNVVTLDASDGKILSDIRMGRNNDNHIRSSLVAAHGQLFIRTNDSLYCIAE